MFKSFLAAILFAAVGSAPSARAFAPCAAGQSEISVEGVNGVFCVAGSTVCAANVERGACPAVQDGLPYGSYCGKVASGVFGCKVLDAESVKTFQPWVDPSAPATPAPTTPAPTTPAPALATPAPTTTLTLATPAPATPAPTSSSGAGGSQCAEGTPVGVEGASGVFCVTAGPVCAADVANGVCPGVQPGLPFGSSCDRVASGVYGCKVRTSSASAGSATPAPAPSAAGASPAATPAVTPAAAGTSAAGTSAAASTPAPPASTPTASAAATAASTPAAAATTAGTSAECPAGGSPMSVEGVQKIFCVTGVACAADIAGGNCPGKQDGLPFGSFCDAVRTGVYGCRAYVGDNTKPASPVAAPLNCTGSAAGGTPVSIVGAKRDFCAQEPICSGNRYGNCPGVQDGLDQATSCVIISTGVFGCVFK